MEKDKKFKKNFRKYCLLAKMEDKKTKRSDKRWKTLSKSEKGVTFSCIPIRIKRYSISNILFDDSFSTGDICQRVARFDLCIQGQFFHTGCFHL